MPFGTYTNPMRTGGAGARLEANAGVIASRKGSAIAVPIPFRNVRLGSALPVIIVLQPPWVSPLPLSAMPLHDAIGREDSARSHRSESETDSRKLRASG